MPLMTRRAIVAGLGTFAVLGIRTAVAALPTLVVSKDPNCGCCEGWVDHLRTSGFGAEVRETTDLAPLKTRLGIPSNLFSCHTAEVENYAIEGHVPAVAIQRLLMQRPRAKGLAVPGMPIGSPGMEVAGRPDEEYSVVIFGDFGQRIYARFKGSKEIS